MSFPVVEAESEASGLRKVAPIMKDSGVQLRKMAFRKVGPSEPPKQGHSGKALRTPESALQVSPKVPSGNSTALRKMPLGATLEKGSSGKTLRTPDASNRSRAGPNPVDIPF